MKVIDPKNLEWEDTPRGYYLTQVKQKVLWKDEKSGATMALVKFPVGVADRIHSHPEANQFFFPLSGEAEITEGEKISLERVLFYCPKGETHGATKFTKECIALFYWDGPPTPEVEE